MKRVVFAVVFVLSVLPVGAQESQTVYNFLRLPVSAHVAALGGDNTTLVEDDATVADKLFAEVRHMIDGKKYELLFEAKDNGEVTRLFTNGNGKTVSSIILTTKDGDEFTFMSLEGNMDREQLENILAESAK